VTGLVAVVVVGATEAVGAVVVVEDVVVVAAGAQEARNATSRAKVRTLTQVLLLKRNPPFLSTQPRQIQSCLARLMVPGFFSGPMPRIALERADVN